MTGGRRTVVVIVAGGVLATSPATAQGPPFVITDSSVVQKPFAALALSRDTLVSTYPRAARELRFRFSIDGRENEFPPGTEHTLYLRPRDGRLVTPLYRFGDEREPPPPPPEESGSSEEGPARVTFRVDLRPVLRQLRSRGRYESRIGAPIRRGDPLHVYVIGEPAPLRWALDSLAPGAPPELRDPDGDGIYEGTLVFETVYTRARAPDGRAVWARTRELSDYPDVESSQRLQDALYRLSLEELSQLVRADGALAAGAKWPGVWTRDVSLSALLSLALVVPDAVRRSLLAKVDASGRIIQDTGTGGSWPVSSDRMVWALAAWEVFAVTGDRDWLRRAFDVVRRSALADLHAVRDPATGLFQGESSFLDWREQSYPRWMQPADIYRSRNLGTNAVHYGAYRVLARMARLLAEPSGAWEEIAATVPTELERQLWLAERGWYGQYRYGRVASTTSPRSDGLGEALSIVTGMVPTERARRLVASAPTMTFGTPTFWPFTAGERFYHNGTIWPFVTAFSTWAAAEAGNTTAVRRGLDALTRATALFLTNKENLVAETGHFEGTALNSDRQLWSVAGTLAATLRVLLGVRLEDDALVFRPVVPPSYGGVRRVHGLRYRGATLDVTVRGAGDGVARATLDGRELPDARLHSAVTGRHAIEITMNERWAPARVHDVAARAAPATPVAHLAGTLLHWRGVADAAQYVVYRDGVARRATPGTAVRVEPPTETLAEFQVAAVSAAGDTSFLSEPVRHIRPGAVLTLRAVADSASAPASRTGSRRPLRLTRTAHRIVTFAVRTARAGPYAIDARYANGSGPVNTDDRVAVRTLLVDGDTAGVLVMPQRGVDRWSDWGWTNVLKVHLGRGAHTVTLAFTPADENMNGRVNTALLDHLRLTPLAPPLRDATRSSSPPSAP